MAVDEREMLLGVAGHCSDFLAGLGTRPVAPTTGLAELRHRLALATPEVGLAEERVIAELIEGADGGLIGSAGGRFFGWVIGGSLPGALAADWLTSTWDQNAALYACSPAVAVIEETCGRWVKELLGLPASASFGIVTGGQMAHVTALAAARHDLLTRCGVDVEAEGLSGAPPLRVLTTGARHGSIERAVRFLGLGSGSIVEVPAGQTGGIRVEALEEALAASGDPTIVVLQAGDINTGLLDPFAEAVPLAHSHGAWVHVDGAFGLWAATSDHHRGLLRGVEAADSWATDAHKWLNVPYDCGIAIVAYPAAHRAAMTSRASYLVHSEDDARDQIDWNPEWSRRGRAVSLYAAIRTLGRRGIAEIVERTSRHADALVRGIGGLPGVEVLSGAHLNQGLVRFLDTAGDHDRRTDAIIGSIQAEGTAWFGGTTWHGMRAMRISVCNWRTTEEDVRLTVDAVARVLEVSAASGPTESSTTGPVRARGLEVRSAPRAGYRAQPEPRVDEDNPDALVRIEPWT